MFRYLKRILIVTISLSFISSCSFAVSKEAYEYYTRGLLASRSGDMERAIKEYEKVLKIDNKAIEVYRELTSLYWRVGKLTQSLYTASKLEELSGPNVETNLFLGNFYLSVGNPDKARQLWEHILDIEPDNETAILYLAAYNTERDLSQAVYYWKKFIEKKPNSAPAYFQLGTCQEKLEQKENAKESYKKAIAIDPNGPDTHLSLASLYEKEGDFTNAVNELKRYLEIAPGNRNVLLYLGGLYYRLKMYDEAKDIFLQAAKTSPGDINIYFWLGIMAEQKKEWNEAIKYFELIRNKDANPAILTRLSFYYSAVKDLKQSLKCLKQVAKLEPYNPNSYYLLGLAYLDLDKFKASEKMLKKAIDLKPDFNEIYFHLGVLYDTWKKFDKAELMMKKAIEINPKNSTALNYLGYSYLDRHIKLEEATDLINRAMAIDPENGAYLDSMGWLCYEKGEYEKAENYLIRASTRITDPVVFEHLGDVSLKLNKTAEAWDAYQKVQNLNIKDKKIAKKIKALEHFVLPKTIQRKVLKRAIGNLLQVSSLSSNFSISGKNTSTNFYSFGTFQYKRPAKWRVDILGNFLTPHVIITQNNGINIYPKALQNNDSMLTDYLDRIRSYFNTEILENFNSDKTTVVEKGDIYTYKLENKSLVIDKRTSTIKEYKENDKVDLFFRKQVLHEGLYLPFEVDIYFPDKKISANLKIKDFNLNKSMLDDVFTPIVQTDNDKQNKAQ